MFSSKNVRQIAYLMIAGSLFALITAAISLGGKFMQDNLAEQEEVSPTISAIRERGYLKCEISNEVDGLATRDYEAEETGEELSLLTVNDITEGFFRHANGLEADICKAVAVAVLGDASAVAFIASGSNRVQRMRSVAAGERDILLRSTRFHQVNKLESVNFSQIYFLEPIVLASSQADTDLTSQSYSSIRVCATGYNLSGFATQQFSDEHQRDWTLVTESSSTGEHFESFRNLINAYTEGQCDGFTGTWSLLRKHATTKENAKLEGIHLRALGQNYLIPHTAIVNSHDQRWLDVVNAVIWALIDSDIRGFSQAGNPEYIRKGLWTALGLEPTNAGKIIADIGNYREIFERNLGDTTPLSEVNRHYMFKHGMLVTPF